MRRSVRHTNRHALSRALVVLSGPDSPERGVERILRTRFWLSVRPRRPAPIANLPTSPLRPPA